MIFQKISTGNIHVCPEAPANKIFFVFACEVLPFKLLCTYVGFRFVTALEEESVYIEVDIPLPADGITEMSIYEDVSPDTYSFITAMIEDIFFEIFYIFFYSWLDELQKFSIGFKIWNLMITHTISPILTDSSTRIHSCMEKLASPSFLFIAP